MFKHSGRKTMRSFTWGMVGLLALFLGSCASPAVSLQSQPQNPQAARDLAKMVADKADCAGFEDYDFSIKDHWKFTCQKANRMFLIQVAANAAMRDDAIRQEGDGKPYKAGRFFVVDEFTAEGQSNTPADLAAFPGDSGLHSNERGQS